MDVNRVVVAPAVPLDFRFSSCPCNNRGKVSSRLSFGILNARL